MGQIVIYYASYIFGGISSLRSLWRIPEYTEEGLQLKNDVVVGQEIVIVKHFNLALHIYSEGINKINMTKKSLTRKDDGKTFITKRCDETHL